MSTDLMDFDTWIDNFVVRRRYDLNHRFENLGTDGNRSVPLGAIVEHCKRTGPDDKVKIRGSLISLDLHGDPLDHFQRLAAALAP
ncbi:MAG: hypothetical protein WBD41_26530 [Rhodococcus sp. (in: high G+C Gram-positive bacteria)]|jgi:hypothetical protein|uniref:Uncharacterized protein n=1 Tax=Rhodococcus baikonurensis TaxID=172041 RepID=A0ABV5XAR0_9NOCA|nr:MULTISPECIES: hypothetical protein [Rhodococcus]ATI36414.1 hypothetical protein CPI83_29900 [Rhodococcus sp. H-CA8f]MCT6735454.1 hypothetical protein [Rhodococcus qingshengii]